jgi:hypothetical protein
LTDEEQLETANQKQAVILTNDADFIRIAVSKTHKGLIYVHQHKMAIGECIRKIQIITETTTAEQMDTQIIFL